MRRSCCRNRRTACAASSGVATSVLGSAGGMLTLSEALPRRRHGPVTRRDSAQYGTAVYRSVEKRNEREGAAATRRAMPAPRDDPDGRRRHPSTEKTHERAGEILSQGRIGRYGLNLKPLQEKQASHTRPSGSATGPLPRKRPRGTTRGPCGTEGDGPPSSHAVPRAHGGWRENP